MKYPMDNNLMKLMKKIIYHYLTLVGFVAVLLTLAACEKDVLSYTQDARVYFFERANDLNRTRITSKSYTFLTLGPNQQSDTLYVKVKTMGDTASYDRVVLGKTISDSTTAIEGQDYYFIPGIVPAGQTMGQVAVVLNRTARLKSETVLLNLTIGETVDFKGGVVEDDKFTLIWSDRLVRPDTWSFYFGNYSDVKYQFVIDVLGIAEFPSQLCARCAINPGEYSLADMQDFASILRVRLREYNNQNPTNPLRDENGQLITF